jgi:hypothetical protein
MSGPNPINIIPTNNEVNFNNVNNKVEITNIISDCAVEVTQPTTTVIQILTGPLGLTGESGASYSGSGSPFPYTGSAAITGSLIITGSLSIYGTFTGGRATKAGVYSHAEGALTEALGVSAHAEGYGSQARGDFSHAEGQNTVTDIDGRAAHAEGLNNFAIGWYSHVEGGFNYSRGLASHAEGENANSVGQYSHAEGNGTQSSGSHSHAEGLRSTSSGNFSHAEGRHTIALGNYQHTQGQYNIASSESSAFIYGNGIDDNNRSNLIFASGSKVQITGSLDISGSLDLVGNIIPTIDSTYSLGSPTNKWKDVYVSTGSIYIGNTILSNSESVLFLNSQPLITVNTSSGQISVPGLSISLSASYSTTASFALNGGVTFPYTGSAIITGSLFLVGQSSFISSPLYSTNDFFLIRNTTTTLKVVNGIQISSSANVPFQVLDTNNNNLLQISQSKVVIFATSSVVLTEAAPNGGIYFTSSSFYIGLD